MKSVKYILLFLITSLSVFALTAADGGASETLDKAAAKLRGASGVACSFELKVGGKTVNGNLYSSGKKFSISSPVSSSWYNGKNMWTYNPSSGETTIVTPTGAELAEVNPLLYVDGWKTNFTAAFAKGGTKSSSTVILTPKKKNSGIKSVIIVINPSTFLPSAVTVVQTGAQPVSIKLKSVNLKANNPTSLFEYPAKKYPKAEIIDLR